MVKNTLFCLCLSGSVSKISGGWGQKNQWEERKNEPLPCINNLSSVWHICNSWPEVGEIVVSHISTDTFPHSSARFNTQPQPFSPRGGKTNHVQQLFKTRSLPAPWTSPPLFSYVQPSVGRSRSPRHTIITTHSPFWRVEQTQSIINGLHHSP